jgi:Flp pilus assembly protein TadD
MRSRDRRKKRRMRKRAAEMAVRSQAVHGGSEAMVDHGDADGSQETGTLPFEIADEPSLEDASDSAVLAVAEIEVERVLPGIGEPPAASEPVADVAPATGLDLALSLDRDGLWEEALETLDECHAKEPDNVQVLVTRGAICASRGRYSEAERNLRDALQREPATVEAHLNLGLVKVRRGLWSEAIPYIRRAIELDTSRASAHFYLGEALNHVDDLEGALQSYQRAAELQPTNPEAFYGLGIVLDRLSRPDEAAQMYRRSREVSGQ